MAEIIGQEAKALGVSQLFAPVVDLARELRFGRVSLIYIPMNHVCKLSEDPKVEETFSEDPFLAGEIGYSYVKGVQSKNVSSMVKHFAGFSAPEQGINTGPVHGGERELRTTYVSYSKRLNS